MKKLFILALAAMFCMAGFAKKHTRGNQRDHKVYRCAGHNAQQGPYCCAGCRHA